MFSTYYRIPGLKYNFIYHDEPIQIFFFVVLPNSKSTKKLYNNLSYKYLFSSRWCDEEYDKDNYIYVTTDHNVQIDSSLIITEIDYY